MRINIFNLDSFRDNPAIKQIASNFSSNTFDVLDILSILFYINHLNAWDEIENFLPILHKFKDPGSFKEAIINLLSLTSGDEEKINLLNTVGSKEVFLKVIRELEEKLRLTNDLEVQKNAVQNAIAKINEYSEYLKAEDERIQSQELRAEGEEAEEIDEIFKVAAKSLGEIQEVMEQSEKTNDDIAFIQTMAKASLDKVSFITETIAKYFVITDENAVQILTAKSLKELAELKKKGLEADTDIISANFNKDTPLLVIQEKGDKLEDIENILIALNLPKEQAVVVSFEEKVTGLNQVLNQLHSAIQSHPKLGPTYAEQMRIYAGQKGVMDELFTTFEGKLPDEWRASVQIQTLEVLRTLIEGLINSFRMQQAIRVAA